MSDHFPEPQDLAVINADDELLDRLAMGGAPVDGDDDVTAMLAAWRDDVVSDRPNLRRAAPAAATARPATARPARASVRRRRVRPATRILLGAAAAVVVLFGGTALLASSARPGSPLWPVAEWLYPERASTVAAQEAQVAIDGAQVAIEAGDYAQAQRLLDSALALVDDVRDAQAAAHLREEIEALRGFLGGLLPSVLPSASGGLPLPTVGPSGILPTGIVPTQILPTGGILPTGILPSCIVPTGIVPTGILPGGILPTGVLC